jgi:hypothetical protein
MMSRRRLCIVAALVLHSVALPQQERIWKEAEISTDSKGVRYSDRVLVKFSSNVISLPKGTAEASRSNINPGFAEIVDYLNNLEKKYREFKLIKRRPNSVWGDTLRVARGTNKIVAVPDFSQVFNIVFAKPVPIDSIMSSLRSVRYVKYTQEPLWISLEATPNDPQYSQQWNLPKIQTGQAWDITTGSATTEIAIVDGYATGTAAENHEDLVNKLSSYGQIYRGGHGRAVASVAAAATNNNLGISSLGWNVKYQPWDELRIDEAVDNGASVINMSWSVWSSNFPPPPPQLPRLRELIIYALLQNVPCVAAAGNDQPGGPTKV